MRHPRPARQCWPRAAARRRQWAPTGRVRRPAVRPARPTRRASAAHLRSLAMTHAQAWRERRRPDPIGYRPHRERSDSEVLVLAVVVVPAERLALLALLRLGRLVLVVVLAALGALALAVLRRLDLRDVGGRPAQVWADGGDREGGHREVDLVTINLDVLLVGVHAAEGHDTGALAERLDDVLRERAPGGAVQEVGRALLLTVTRTLV